MTTQDFVLGIHPSARGLGWILFEGPATMFDYGSVEIHGPDKSDQTMARVATLLEKYQPAVLVLEESDGMSSKRSPRMRRLYRALVALAYRHGVTVRQYGRTEIAKALGVNNRERRAVARAVAARIEALKSRLLRPKQIWLGEDPHMGLFCAAACVLTYYAGQTQSP